MAQIKALAIKGIRSFDKDNFHVIKFQTPLTVICGENGSGKTTIIECLKYGTIGVQPPNTSPGAAFIHDPQLVNEDKILAQVKISFISANKANMVISRSLQVVMKRSTRSQTTLDTTLNMKKNNETLVMTRKQTELDECMPYYLGVSKAVLDNVVFCHQEESLWPLSNSSTLKKKFDEIFEAQRYTKAIENIRQLRNTHTNDLNVHKGREQELKREKGVSEESEKTMINLQAEIENLREDLPMLGEQLRVAEETAQDAWEHQCKYQSILDELDSQHKTLTNKKANVEKSKKHMDLVQDSDEDLKSMLSQYEERQQTYQVDLEKKMQAYGQLDLDRKQREQERDEKQTELGKLEGEKVHYERQLVNREALVKEVAHHHSIRGFDRELSGKQVADFMERISKMVKEHSAASDRARRESQQETHDAQLALNSLNERQAVLNQTKEGAKSQISSNGKDLAARQNELNKLNVDEGYKATTELKVQELDEKLRKLKDDQSSSNRDKKIDAAETELRNLETQKDLLDAQMAKASDDAEEQAQIKLHQKALKDNKAALETMKGVHGAKISNAVGADWTLDTLESTFERALGQKDTELHDAEAQQKGTQQELREMEMKLDAAKNDKAKKTSMMQQCEKKVSDVVGDEASEYLDALKTAEANRDVFKQDLDSSDASKKYFTDCLDTVHKHDVCRLCERPFKNDKEREKVVSRLEKFISKAVDDIAEDLATAEKELKLLRDVRSDYDTMLKLSQTEIPQLDAEIRRLQPLRDSLVSRMEAKDRTVEDCLDSKRDLASIGKTIELVVKYHRDITRGEDQVRDLTAKQARNGQSGSMDEIRAQQQSLNERIKSLQKDLKAMTVDRDGANKQISVLLEQRSSADSELRTAVAQLQQKTNILTRIDELKQATQKQREIVTDADAELQSLVPQISQAEAKLLDVRNRGDARSQEIQNEHLRLKSSVNKLETGEKDIKDYIDRNGPEQLTRAQRERERILESLSHIHTELQGLTREINKIKEQQANHGKIRTNIERNIEYREELLEMNAVQEKIAELEAYNAGKDRDYWKTENGKWQAKRAKALSERDKAVTMMAAKDQELLKRKDDWQKYYSDSAFKYKEAHVMVEATKAAIEDLSRYGGALDTAVMKYHSLKMGQINDIMAEMWRRTYRGTDVDSIAIRSEGGGTGNTRSHHYRVVMRKGNVEMDMRGRCSAGQKVLACIIIRLALADCFGVKCGIIALDEPTTNLDRENIQSLAESLHEIIKSRESQENFQLVVITHDQEFLSYMNCSDFCDTYYHVSRNDRQTSQIRQQSIADLDFS